MEKKGRIKKFLEESKFIDKVKKVAPKVLDTIGDITGRETFKNLADLIDKDTTIRPLDKKELKQLYDLELKTLELYYEDVQSARNREIEVAKTNSSWLVKNIVPILAASWTLFTFTLYVMALTGNLHAKDTMQTLVINSITNVIMLIIGYYFGSSKGSKDKNKLIK